MNPAGSGWGSLVCFVCDSSCVTLVARAAKPSGRLSHIFWEIVCKFKNYGYICSKIIN